MYFDMSLYCSIMGPNIPSILRQGKSNELFTLNHVVPPGSIFLSRHHKFPHKLSRHIGFVSKFNQIFSSPVMEEDFKKLGHVSESEAEEYSKELHVAVRAVQMACSLCQKVQGTLISKSKSNNQVQSEDDNSLVTVADWSVRAIISWVLFQCFGSENVSIQTEDDAQALSRSANSKLLESVVITVNECLAEAPRFGVQDPKSSLGTSEILEIIGGFNSVGGPSRRFWVLNPVDGKLGFVHGDQYAVALALIEDGEVVVGVLGCPDYPMRKEWLSYHHSYHGIISKLTPPTSEAWDKGCVIYAKRGGGKAWMQPLLHVNKKFVWPNHAKQVSVSSIDNPELATFCEPVKKVNSSHSFTAGLAHSVGLRKQPPRACSMVKYAAMACGDAEVFMKFARAGYKEKIKDHAAGVIILQEAGGMVTDARGNPLDFSKGLCLEGLDRGVVACAGATLHEKIIEAVDASWASSCL